jgi:hypothetical protein
MRLSELYALDILDRFRPQAWGSPSPFHWVLGSLGAALIAAEAGIDLADLSWRRSLVYVSCFPSRDEMRKYLHQIAWETEVWCADNPTHLIHFNGERFLGPYED